MSNILDFTPRSELKAAQNLDQFIVWAKGALGQGIVSKRVHDSIQWEMSSWHAQGIKNATFTGLCSTISAPIDMQAPFIDFAKAMVIYHFLWQRKSVSSPHMIALRSLEAALLEIYGRGDITRLNAAICNRACEYLSRYKNPYKLGKTLQKLVALVREKGLLAHPFQWRSPILQPPKQTLDDIEKNAEKKLPSPVALKALGEIFVADPQDPLDKVVSSVVALMLSNPCRIGELADIEKDCVFFREFAQGNKRMFLRWYAEKIRSPKIVPVVTGMEPVVEEVLKRIIPLTEEARQYAAWLEDNPDTFPVHDRLPNKGPDEPLNYEEVCAALKIAVSKGNSARSRFKEFINRCFINKLEKLSPKAREVASEIWEGWDQGRGKPVTVKGKPGIQCFEFDDKATITLRKLNVLVREAYLPKHFPYTTPYQEGRDRIKFRNALFTVRTGIFFESKSQLRTRDLGVGIAASSSRIISQLSNGGNTVGIFERWGYKGVSVNTHAFRHELNTQMHKAGLSQLLIDSFSGRTSMGAVYNHETIEERTQAVAIVAPATKQRNKGDLLQKVTTNAPLSLSYVIDLEGDQSDRIIHKTHLGICIHHFDVEPCPKMGACLTCGKLCCVKGDDVKLANLKDERKALVINLDKAKKAEAEGGFGASTWRERTAKDLFKCDVLIKTLESPELENGDIVWNADNGWTVNTNAMAMIGMLDPQEIEQQTDVMPALENLSAMLEEIEV